MTSSFFSLLLLFLSERLPRYDLKTQLEKRPVNLKVDEKYTTLALKKIQKEKGKFTIHYREI